MENEAMAAAGLAAGVVAFVVIFSLLITILMIVAYWKICEKAGFPGPLALLTLVPIANFILVLYIAFAEWPALKQNKAQQPPQQP